MDRSDRYAIRCTVCVKHNGSHRRYTVGRNYGGCSNVTVLHIGSSLTHTHASHPHPLQPPSYILRGNDACGDVRGGTVGRPPRRWSDVCVGHSLTCGVHLQRPHVQTHHGGSVPDNIATHVLRARSGRLGAQLRNRRPWYTYHTHSPQSVTVPGPPVCDAQQIHPYHKHRWRRRRCCAGQ